MAEETFEIEDLEQELNDVKEREAKPTTKRKNIIIGIISGVVFIALALFSFTFFDLSSSTQKTESSLNNNAISNKVKQKKAKKVKYEVLYQKVSASDTSKIIKKLSFNDIQFNLKENGQDYTLLIENTKLEQAKILLALNGLPSGSLKGYELLDESQTLGVTEFDKKVRFLRALSGEIEKAILQFEMVDDVKVQIVMPKERLFVTKQPPVTAAVLLRTSNLYKINDSVVFSIMQLVAGAVENLELKNISVVNTKGDNLSLGLLKRMDGEDYQNPFDLEKKNTVVKVDKEVEQEKKLKEESILQPVQANLKNINAWLDLKNKFEENMTKKLNQQLKSAFPKDSFNVTVTMELSSSLDGESADIKQTSVSILVDENNEEIFLDQEKKIQVFSIVAAVIGYKKNRDTIQLSRASFESENTQRSPINLFWVYIVISMLTLCGIFYFLYRRFIFKSPVKNIVNSPFSDQDSKKLDDFSDLNDEIKLEESLDKIKSISFENPKKIAKVIEGIMSKEENVK